MADAGVPGPATTSERADRVRRSSPYTQRHIARWLAGHGIDRALAEGAVPDPLHGGYRVLPQQQVLVMNSAKHRRYRVDALTSRLQADSGDRYRLVPTTTHEAGEATDGRRLALVAADFDGDGRDEVAWLTGEGTALTLVLARGVEGLQVASRTALSYRNHGPVTLVAGVLHDSGADDPLSAQLVLSWVDENRRVHLEVFTVDERLTPVHVTGVELDALDTPSDRYAVVAGDVRSTGLDWVVVSWPGRDQLMVRLCQVRDGAFVTHPAVPVGPLAGRRVVALTVGDFNRDAVDEIAVAWERSVNRASVALLVAGDDGRVQARGRWDDTDSDTALTGVGCLALTAGYFGAGAGTSGDAALADQLVFGYEIGDHEVSVRLFESDSALNLGPKYLRASTRIGNALPYWFVAYDLVLATGNLAGGALNAVVVGAIGTSRNPLIVLGGYATVTVGLLPVSPGLSAFGRLNVEDSYTYDLAQDLTGGFRLGLALGDLTGASVRVGPPRAHTVDRVDQVVAVVNALPLHVVRRDCEEPLSVNFDGLSYVSFEDEHGRETELTSELRKDWGYSSELRGGIRTPLSLVEVSLTNRYGESFSRVSVNNVRAVVRLAKPDIWNEDAVVLLTTSYTVWEYDVYDSGDLRPAGQLAVVFPSSLAPIPSTKGSDDILFGYYVDHVIGDALSYPTPTELPDDYSAARLLGAANLAVGASQTELVVNWTSTSDRTEVRESEQAIEVGTQLELNPQFRGISLGIGVELHGHYAEDEMKSIKTTLDQTTEITIHYNGLQAERRFAYSVTPLVYWSKRWGYLVVDYLVNIPSDKTFPTAWDRTYADVCDLGFSLPWLDGGKGEEFIHLTRSIYLRHDIAADELVAEVTVTNTGLRPARSVPVDLYDGPPDKQDRLGRVTIFEIGPRGHATVTYRWAARPGIHDIWAVIDPDEQQPDPYRKNNTGWSRLIVPPALPA
jgi:hypothetical protein